MPGALLRVVSKRVFDFSTIAVGSTQAFTVAERLDISQFIEGVVTLRVHSAISTGGTITFDLHGDGCTDEDPGLTFRTNTPLFGAVAISTSATQLLQYGGIVRGQYAVLRVAGNRTSAAALTATVSLDLVLKDPD